MFLRLLIESFARQKRRKALAGAAILLGTTAVTAMLALATSIGDRIHRELAVYGANIVVYPKADTLDVKIAGVDVKPSTGGAYLKESDLDKLHGIFWANNITGVSPELNARLDLISKGEAERNIEVTGFWFRHNSSSDGVQNQDTGAPQLHPSWKLQGAWPHGEIREMPVPAGGTLPFAEIALGSALARRMHARVGDIYFPMLPHAQSDSEFVNVELEVSGIVSTGDHMDDEVFAPLAVVQRISQRPNAVSRVEISATTRPEDAFARLDPDKLSPKQHDLWYCRPYANSIAYQIMEAIPGAQAEQVRQVEQTEGTLLERISGLMWLVSAAALLAAGFAVSAAMATAVLERRGEIGLMRSLGASKAAIAALFYAESSLLAVVAGAFGYLGGSALAFWLGRRIFPADAFSALLTPVLLPVVVAMAVVVAVLGSTPSIRAALRVDPAATLRGGE